MKNFTLFLVILTVVSLVIYAWINYTIVTGIINVGILAFIIYQMKIAPLISADVNTD